MKKFLIILIAASLTACVVEPIPQKRWYKDGVSTYDTKSKFNRCVYDVGMNKVDPIQNERLITACMLAEGFRWGVPPRN